MSATAGPPGAPRAAFWALAVVVCTAVAVRLPNFDSPLVGLHDFRQTQTAITAREMVRDGFAVLSYETPVFGPPWRLPLEFPVYQWSAAAVARFGGMTVDVACRIVSLIWFSLAAWILFRLVDRHAGRGLAIAGLATFLLGPFAIHWSRAALIDFAAVALALVYLYFGLEALEGKKWVSLMIGSLAGGLAAATKPMAWLGAAAVLVGIWLSRSIGSSLRRDSGSASESAADAAGEKREIIPARWLGWFGWFRWLGHRPSGQRGGAGVSGLVLFSIPALALFWWTASADQIKSVSPATAWLTSGELRSWTIGDWALRFDGRTWLRLLGRIEARAFPGPLALLPLGAGLLRRRDPAAFRVAAWAWVSVLLPIPVFFPLFVEHDYYLIAVLPGLAVACAAGFVGLCRAVQDRWAGRSDLTPRMPRIHSTARLVSSTLIVAVVLVLATVPFLGRAWRMYGYMYSISWNAAPVRLGSLVRTTSAADDWVAVEGDFWNPRILYFADRRGLMLRDHELPPVEEARRYRLLVCRICAPQLRERWPPLELVGEEVGFRVFRVAGDSAMASMRQSEPR